MKLRNLLMVAFFTMSSIFSAQWTVIGGGPAGIVIVGLLLDLGVAPQEVVWVDPEFNVGRLGQYYETVPGNTKTKLYIDFMNSCKTFLASGSPAIAALHDYESALEYPLSIIVKPLQDVTVYMRTLVQSHKTIVTGLESSTNDQWHLELADGTEFDSTCVVFATGSHPQSLNYACANEISLDCALNKKFLARYVTPEDTIAVVGSAHSAVLAMKFLSELPVGRIINFYKKPLTYTQDMGNWQIYSSSGLKGVAAEWAKNVLEKNPPANLIRLFNHQANRDAWLPICTKIIYAAGYERNTLPAINNVENPTVEYDTHTGRIAPGLFGIGIAFPEVIIDQAGNEEHKVGLNSFMNHALEMLPLWLQNRDKACRYKQFEELFDICIL